MTERIPIHHIEEERSNCPFCGFGVYSHWAVGANNEQLGMISEPQVTLIGPWVSHSECVDKSVEEYNL